MNVSEVAPERGRIATGRGRSALDIGPLRPGIARIIGADPYPGSLNVVLQRPRRLPRELGRPIDAWGKRRLWAGRMGDEPVWLYRWRGAPLHIVEVLSPHELRPRLRLQDGDEVVISSSWQAPTCFERVAWSLLWGRGRQHLFYRQDRYPAIVRRLDRRLWTMQR